MSLPPAQPAYILRGHAAQVHSTTFIRANSRLVTADAEGWIVIWSLATKRAVAVWRAHEGAILGSAAGDHDSLITHGKDNKLVVWKLTEQDEALMSTTLPVEDSITWRRQPWLLHVLHVNTLNFCSFAYCKTLEHLIQPHQDDLAQYEDNRHLLIAVPNTLSSETVDIFHLPSERRIHTISGDLSLKTVIVGYESGHTMVSQQVNGQGWQILYLSHPHSQPILSLDVDKKFSTYMTSSADAIIAKHPIPNIPRKDASFAQSRAAPLIEVAASNNGRSSLLSQSLASDVVKGRSTYQPNIEIKTTPIKVRQTKHSGQQGLKVRSDSKIFATAGWDSRIRVYSVQSLTEVAVLKWHKEGCYAVAFADILDSVAEENKSTGEGDVTSTKPSEEQTLVAVATSLTVKEKRDRKATTTHWVAAGSKDGKVSLWDIY